MSVHTARDHAVSAADARLSLAAVLGSAQFRTCPRLASFLHFVVTATLAGDGGRLKGYTIAVEALGRDMSFDPQADPIVRVEAVRLRAALARYYAGEGAAERIVIEMPRGHYACVFRRKPVAEATIWARARGVLHRLLAAEGAWLLPTAAIAGQAADGREIRKVQPTEGAPAARSRRPRSGRDRGDAADDRDDPHGL